jgi:DNA polymerase sigma
MNDRRLLRAIERIVLDYCGDELISLYSIGSFSSHEMIPSSDVDLVGVMKPSFDFGKENRLNEVLNEKIHSSHKIDLGTMSYAEFFGGLKRAVL